MRKILTTTLLASSLILSFANAFASTPEVEVSANNTAGTAKALQEVSNLSLNAMQESARLYAEAPATLGTALTKAGATKKDLKLTGPMKDYIDRAADKTFLDTDYSITITLLGQATQTGGSTTSISQDANETWYGPQYMGGAIFKFIPLVNTKKTGIASWACVTTVDSGLTNPVAVGSPSRVTRLQSQMDGTSSEAVNLNPVLSSCIYVGSSI
jgi:hypothetical protein